MTELEASECTSAVAWNEGGRERRERQTVRNGAGTIQPNSPGRQVLVVEDDPALAELLTAELQSLKFTVELLSERTGLFQALQRMRRYDLLILDLNLPSSEGGNMLKEIRIAQPRLPILALSPRGTVVDKVSALESGADDCLGKPFSLLELIARVHALLRRNSAFAPNCSSVGDLTMFRDEHRVERNGRRIELTPREYAILDVMMRNAGRPVSRAILLEEVWNTTAQSSTNIVDVYMKYLRDKIDLPGESRLTHTVRGFGYELRSVQ